MISGILGMNIQSASEQYLDTVKFARSDNTFHTYTNGINHFLEMLKNKGIDPQEISIGALNEDHFSLFISTLKDLSPSSERLYLTSVKGFYEYVASEKLADVNVVRIQLLVKQRSRRPGIRLPQFPKTNIQTVLEAADALAARQCEFDYEHLINLRDRAFLFCLADTGLRVHEACNLRRGDIDWFEFRAVVVGKGNREAVIRFSERSLQKIKEYLSARATLDGATGVPLTSLPLFARHDKGSGKKVKPITTTTGRNIVAARVKEFLGEEAVGTITPHSFRHFFVTKVLQGSGNLKLAQSLARHTNIAVTQRYAHINDDELDRGYKEIFEDDQN
jgi:site-specific recombinase XerD